MGGAGERGALAVWLAMQILRGRGRVRWEITRIRKGGVIGVLSLWLEKSSASVGAGNAA
jgi:hypothetical protein